MSQTGTTQFVTGPGTAKVYVMPNFINQANTYRTYPTVYRGWNKIDGEWVKIDQPLHISATGWSPSRDGYSSVRRAIQLWNAKHREMAGQQAPKFLELTKDRSQADTIINDTDPPNEDLPTSDNPAAIGTGAYPEPGQTENIMIREGWETAEGVIAHELGHTMGLKHHHEGDHPSVMKYPGDKGKTEKPTSFDVKKVANKKSPETQVGVGASTGAKVVEHKPKGKVAHSGPANKRQVTGSGGKVRV